MNAVINKCFAIVAPVSPRKFIPTLADSGATDTLIRASDIPPTKIINTSTPLTVTLPNGQHIHSIGNVQFPLSDKRTLVDAHVFHDGDLSDSLTALAPLCNQGCTASFTQHDVTVINAQGQRVLHGLKDAHSLLWPMPLPISTINEPTPTNAAHNVIRNDIDAEFVLFAHACFGFPAISTFLHAAKHGYLDSFPRLTAKMIAANQPNIVATAQGHLDRARQRAQLTQSASPPPPVSQAPFDKLASDKSNNDKGENDAADVLDDYHNVFTLLMPVANIGHVDMTGRFPLASRRGFKYILVAVLNGYIHLECLRSRTSTDLVAAYASTIKFFAKHQHPVNIMRLDNETLSELDAYLRTTVTEVQHVPPHTHRANRAERAIRTAKTISLQR